MLDQLEWLLGQWEGIHGSGIYHEEWQRGSNNDLEGRAFFLSKGEIKNVEKLRIHSEGINMFYTATVDHNRGPVSFKLTGCDDAQFIFENPDHDFPKKISYIRKSENELCAIISSDTDGKSAKSEFNLRKIR